MRAGNQGILKHLSEKVFFSCFLKAKMDVEGLIYNRKGFQSFGAIVAKTLSPLNFKYGRGTARNS